MAKIGEADPEDGSARKARTYQLAARARARGHHVVWWSSAFNHPTKSWLAPRTSRRLLDNGVELRLVRGIGYRKNVSLRRLLDHRLISWKLERLLDEEEPPDLIIASYPAYDVADVFARFGRRRQIPVVVDVRDPWPDSFLGVLPRPLRPVGRALLVPEFRRAASSVSRAAAIYAVTETHLELALRKAGRPRGEEDRVFFNSYDEQQAADGGSELAAEVVARARGRTVVFFFGVFGAVHDAAMLVEVARRLPSERFFFVLAGRGDEEERVRTGAEALENVFLPGWIDLGGIRSIAAVSHIGAAPTRMQTDVLPNKAIVYMAAGLPVVSGFQGDLPGILAERDCGVTVGPQDVDGFVDALTRIEAEPEERAAMGRRAREAYEELFVPDSVYERYLDAVEQLTAP